MNGFKGVLLLLVLALSPAVFGQEAIPGLIPRFYSIEAATDLPISPEEAHEKAQKGLIDLSLLDPDSTTNVWNPDKRDITSPQLLSSGSTVEYTGDLASRTGSYRFTVRNGGQELVVVLSKKVHNFLLRKNILEKAGYTVPAMTWVPKVTVRFKNTIDRDLFLEELKDRLLGGQDRWITSKDGLDISLQDALVLTPDSNIYNLTLGLMDRSVHMGRRVLRAPYVAIAMVDTPESVNLMPWQAGRLIFDQMKLYHSQDIGSTFGTSWEDARWLGRRLARLSRRDLEEVVEKAYYPEPIAKLLTEKIVARRNDLVKMLKLESEFRELSFSPDVTLAPALVKGEIVQEFFPGYATRFSFGDPESPFNSSEIGSFVLSELQSQAFNVALDYLNKFIGTQDEKIYKKKLGEIIKKEGLLFPTTAIIVPSAHGHVILSRDIVAGSYLGTNHKVQLVDNIGVSLDAGFSGGVEGLPIPIRVSAHSVVEIQRLFSHIKPVETLKKSIREPYKNLMVPLILRGLGKTIEKLSAATPENQELLVQGVVGELKKAIGVGESFVITDSVVPSLGIQVGVSVPVGDPNLLRVYTQANSNRVILSRFHFFRADENTFHVYQDRATGTKLMASIGLKSYIPVLKFGGGWGKLKIATDYVPLDLRAGKIDVPTLKALRIAILSHKSDALRDLVTPHHIDHTVRERDSTLQFLFFKRNRIGSDHAVDVMHALGGEKFQIKKRYDSWTTGLDFENFAADAINELISIIAKSDTFSLKNSAVLNPGFTIGGRAKNRIFSTEFDGRRFSTLYQRIFNGWKAKKDRVASLIRDINKEYGGTLFNPLVYKDVNAILLYNIQLQTVISQEGTQRLIDMNETTVRALIEKNPVSPVSPKIKESVISGFVERGKKIRALMVSSPESALKEYHGFLNSLFDTVQISAIVEIAGKENFFFVGRIDGFREGDEGGDSPIFSDITGGMPIPMQVFPSQKVMEKTGIIEGELMANWATAQAI